MNQYLQYKWTLKLGMLLVLLPAAVYFFAIKRTIDMWRSVERNRQQIERLTAADTLPPAETKNDVSAWTKELFAAAEQSGTVIKSFTPYHMKTDAGLDVYTTEAVFSGDFITVVEIIACLEKTIEANNDFGTGKIVSVEFRTVNGNTKETVKELETSVIFQQIF